MSDADKMFEEQLKLDSIKIIAEEILNKQIRGGRITPLVRKDTEAFNKILNIIKED